MNRIRHWARNSSKTCYKMGFTNNGGMVCGIFIFLLLLFLLLALTGIINLPIYISISILLVIAIVFFGTISTY